MLREKNEKLKIDENHFNISKRSCDPNGLGMEVIVLIEIKINVCN